MQTIKLPYDSKTDYSVQENLDNLSVRGLGDLLSSLGSNKYNEIQREYANNTRGLRQILLDELQLILKADRDFSFDESETNVSESASESASESNASESEEDSLDDIGSVDGTTEEDPLNGILLDDLESAGVEDPMDLVTSTVDKMDRQACVDHVEKYLPAQNTYEGWRDFSTTDLRGMLLEYYYEIQTGLNAVDDESEFEGIQAESSDSTDEELDLDIDSLNSDFDPDQETEEENEFEENEFEENEENEFEENEENEFEETEFEETEFEENEENETTQDYVMNRVESVNYLRDTNVPHIEIQTQARLIIQLYAESNQDLTSVEISELENVSGIDGEVYDLQHPLRSLSAARNNDHNVGFATTAIEGVVRLLAEFNAANRTYVGPLNYIQITMHTLLNNLTEALDSVTMLSENCGLNLPEDFSINNFLGIKVCLNSDKIDTTSFFDVVVHLNVPFLNSVRSEQKFEQMLVSLTKILSKITDSVLEDTDSNVEHGFVFAASVSSILNNDAIRDYVSSQPNYKLTELISIAEQESEEESEEDFEETDETDESYLENSEAETEEQPYQPLLVDFAQSHQGVDSLTLWDNAVVVDLISA
jgi:hypothetical protein